MADYFEGLHLLPDHMHDSVKRWIERGEPKPELLGSFLRAVLCGKLFEALAHADDVNANRIKEWALFLHNYAPSACYGNPEKLTAWAERGGLVGIAREIAASG